MKALSNIIIFLSLISIKAVEDDVIRVSSSSRNSNQNIIRAQKVYRKFQIPTRYVIGSESDVYAKVTGLSLAFYLTDPVLFKIRFEASCWNLNAPSWVFPRIMINDLLLYNDKFLKNTDDRYKSIPGFTGIHGVDQIGAGHYYTSTETLITMIKSEIVYLQPGLYVIDVVARAIGRMPVHISYGVLTIELVQYENGVDLGDMKSANFTATN